MEDGKKKIWLCILVVTAAAVAIGILYYFSTPEDMSEEGYLIRGAGAARCAAAAVQPAETPEPETILAGMGQIPAETGWEPAETTVIRPVRGEHDGF